ncbi:hypothetical protein E4U45_005206 [Claviceps purpurea]|nr:hypothetical protein E4U45_005206 [Claviceps purpurea]
MKFICLKSTIGVLSSRAEETPIGAEYILMEKMEGVELEEVWPEMEIEDRLEVVKAVAAYQLSWASVSFEQYGFTEACTLPKTLKGKTYRRLCTQMIRGGG